MGRWTRRAFLITGGILGGGLAVGVGGALFAPNRLGIGKPPARDSVPIVTWLKIAPDDSVTVLVPHAEMGQGVHTALAMMAAEELDADWNKVSIEEAPATGAFANGYVVNALLEGRTVPQALLRGFDYGTYKLTELMHLQITGGSASVRATGEHGMRIAGAAAKTMLIEAAASQWRVPVRECRARKGVVYHDANGRSARFGVLAYAAAALTPPATPALKRREDFTIVGTHKPRHDIPAKVDGSAVYGIDVRLPGMLYAAVMASPVSGGTLGAVDTSPATARPGVYKVVQLNNAVAVVADSFWRAKAALETLAPRFIDGVNANASSALLFDQLRKQLTEDSGSRIHKSGRGRSALDGASALIEAEYRVPFLAHATMEPMSCTARVTGNACEVYVGVQDPLSARKVAAEAAGLKPEQVSLRNHLLGGGFGRKLPDNFDFVDQAVRIAKAVSPAPVKLVWTREEDIRQDYYRPAVISRFQGALGPDGLPSAWVNDYSHADGASAIPPYAIKNQDIRKRTSTYPVRIGAWRSVEHSQQGFFIESFIDELAHAAGKDPYTYRYALLPDKPRHRAVLALAAEKAGWSQPSAPGTGRGIALVESFGTIVAEVAEVTVSATGALKVKRITAAVDCGDVISPDGARAQIEGGIVFGLSATLLSEITVENGRVKQSNFWDHEVARLAHTPDIDVHFIRSGAPLGGLGEPGVPPAAPAVTNAVFAATGKRIRSLPLKNHDLTPLPGNLAAAPAPVSAE